MTDQDNKVRVFISSTFRDMHAERDHLVTVVFPELRERCERLRLEFFDVDLRWGVPEKTVDGETANSWEYCRQWIDRVEPFFVCLLGQRYGWEPEPEELKNKADRKRQRKMKRSITDMEVRYAVLDTQLQRHSYFYLRQAEAPTTATDFVDPPPLLAKLNQLKTETQDSGRPVRLYPCEWTGDAFTGMEEFGRMVLDDLWSGVLRDPRYVSKQAWKQVLGTDPDRDLRYTDESVPVPDDIAEKLIPLAKPPPKDPLEAEREQMAAFADSRVRWFQGRTQEIDDLAAFIHDLAEDNAPRLAVIAAAPGQGKSAVMAKLSQSLGSPSPPISPLPSLLVISHFIHRLCRFLLLGRTPSPSLLVISHFVGATETSSGSYALVKRLIDELDASGIAFPEPPQPEDQPRDDLKLDFNSLCLRLSERLGNYDGERRIVLLLDALNQLDDGHELGWLPHRIGPGVRIVVSCIDDPSSQDDSTERKVLTALQARFLKPKFVPLGGLDQQDVRTIVTDYFLEYCKELDTPYVDAICAMLQARNPLYLLVLLGELRTLGGNDMNRVVPGLIASLPQDHPDTVSLFKWVLKRLEVFGAEAVQWWCVYLALGRAGMASRELADLLARKLGPEGAATALRIERGLRRYLQRRGDTLDFFHGQLRQAVMEKYGHEQSVRESHHDISDYFRSLADPNENLGWGGNGVRSFNEIAFHLIGAQQWDDLCSYLTDFRCLDVRIRAEQIFAVVTDQRAAIEALPELAEEARRKDEQFKICARYGEALITYARDSSLGKNSILPEPPATRKTANIGAIPTERAPRAERLKAIATFTGQHSSLLAAFPVNFLPLAANAANGSPLAEAAELADASARPWLKRSPPPPTSSLRPQCLLTLWGNTSHVESVSMTSDGRRAISGSLDNTLRLWDLVTGECVQTLRGHTDAVRSVSMTPDGLIAVSVSLETLRVWDLVQGCCLITVKMNAYMINSVSITPDGQLAVSGGGDNKLRLWHLTTGKCLIILQGHTADVTSVSMTPDGQRAVSGSWDNTLRLWCLTTGKCLQILEGHTSRINSVSLTPDCRRAISGGWDRTLRLWDITSGECLASLHGHTGRINSVSLTPDGRRAVSCGGNWDEKDYMVRLWDVDSGECLSTLQGHTAVVSSVCLTPDGRRALSAGHDKGLRVWDVTSDQHQPTLMGHTDVVRSVSIAPDGRHVVSVSNDRTLRIWDMITGGCVQTLLGHTNVVSSVSITPDGQRAVSGSVDETLRLWDLTSGQTLQILEAFYVISSVSVTPDGKRAISTGSDFIEIWDLITGECTNTLIEHTETVKGVCLTPDGRCAVSYSDDRTLRLWDLETGECLRILQGHSNTINCVVVTPDGRQAISAGHDATLRLWDLHSGMCLHTLKGHMHSIYSVAVTPDGRHAISASYDQTLQLWDLNSGQSVQTLRGHTDCVNSVSIAPDGWHAVSASNDQTVRVWNLKSGQCLAVYHAGASAWFGNISPAGDRIVCGTSDGQLHFLTPHCFSFPGVAAHSPVFGNRNDEDYEKILRSGREICHRIKGDNHEDTLAHLSALARLLEKIGKVEEASAIDSKLNHLIAGAHVTENSELIQPVVNEPEEDEGVHIIETNESHVLVAESFHDHLKAAVMVPTIAIVFGWAVALASIIRGLQVDPNSVLSGLVWGASGGSFMGICAVFRFAYPALEGRREKVLAWLIAIGTLIFGGACTGIALIFQRLADQIVNYHPASNYEYVAKGMIISALVGTWVVFMVIRRFPQCKAYATRIDSRIHVVALLAAAFLPLPAQVFPAVVAVVFLNISMVVCSFWGGWIWVRMQDTSSPFINQHEPK